MMDASTVGTQHKPNRHGCLASVLPALVRSSLFFAGPPALRAPDITSGLPLMALHLRQDVPLQREGVA